MAVMLAGCPDRRGLEVDAGPGGGAGMGGSKPGTGGGHGGATGGTGGTTFGGSGGGGSGTGGTSPGTGGASSGDAGVDGLPSAVLAIQPLSNDFDMVVMGTTSEAPFDITNTGTGTSGPVAVTVTGADFTVTTNTCAGSLAPGAHCTANVRFAPAALGAKTGTLTATASPGGTASATLKGTGIAPGALTIMPTSSSFGSLAPGATSAPVTFTVSNTGQATSGVLAASIVGSTDFQITTNGCDGKSLPAAGTCTVVVTFTPAAAGSRSGTLRVTASPGGTASAALTGTGARPAVLSASASAHDFGDLETGVASAATTITITNTGDVASGTLALTNSASSEITATNGCTGTLAAGASCTIMATFKPSTGGARSGSLSLAASPGGTVAITLTARGMFRLTVTRTGTGTVTSSPDGISCGATCTGLFPSGLVTLQARPSNGSNMRFGGWTGGDCAGVGFCAITLAASTTVTAPFVALTANLIFVSSATFATNLGAVSNYDAKCNTEATGVGINDSAGNGYVAFISSSASMATARLGSARGWVNLEGKPVLDTVAAAFSSAQVFNAVVLNENGIPITDGGSIMTGVGVDGALVPNGNCSSWTGTGSWAGGSPWDGPHDWASNLLGDCPQMAHLLCMGKTRTSTVGPAVTSGKRIWVSSANYVVGGATTPDGLCQAERPTGVTTAVALLPSTTKSAASLLSPATNYVRPDGTLVGTGAVIGAGTLLDSGIWQLASGAYADAMYMVWTGSPTPSAVGTTDTTCGNWMNASLTLPRLRTGRANAVSSDFWSWGSEGGCDVAARLYCVQTAP